MPKRKPISASELIAELESDPEWVARRDERDRLHGESVEAARHVSEPLLAAIRGVGVSIDSLSAVSQLSDADFQKALPILIDWLTLASDRALRLGVSAVLASDRARPAAARPLLDAFSARDASMDESIRWSIGSALVEVSDGSVLDDLARLAADRSYGKAREMLAWALGKTGDPRALPILIELLDDDELTGHAAMGLGELGDPEALLALEAYREHPTPWVQKEVRRALARLGSE